MGRRWEWGSDFRSSRGKGYPHPLEAGTVPLVLSVGGRRSARAVGDDDLSICRCNGRNADTVRRGKDGERGRTDNELTGFRSWRYPQAPQPKLSR